MTLAYFAIADGFNVAEGSLTRVTPQPQGQPVAPVVRNHGLSGIVHDYGAWCEWRWPVVEGDSEWLALMTLLGLHNALNNEVTINTRSNRVQWARYNALATLPEPMTDVRWNYFPVDTVVRFTRLVAL